MPLQSNISGISLFDSKFFLFLFFLGLIIRLYLIFCVPPEMIANLFAPFLQHFINYPFQNPYNYFLILERLDIFPYGISMALGAVLLYFPFQWIGGTGYAGFGLSLLVFDTAILVLLTKMIPKQKIFLCLIYWLSPLVIYINYWHGQLDLIPIFFLMLGLYWLDKNLTFSSLSFGIALSMKLHILMILPFYAIYLSKQKLPMKKIIIYFLETGIPYFIFNGIFLGSPGFQQIVLFNKVQNYILHFQLSIGSTTIYIIPVLYGILCLGCLYFSRLPKDLFMIYIVFAFSLITLFLTPQPGWFYWIIPLLAYISAKYQRTLLPLYFLNSTLLVVYFVNRDMIYSHLLYTVFFFLQIVILWNLFINILHRYVGTNFLYRPYFIGIAGDSGTGKTTLAVGLLNFFGEENSLLFCGDDLHKWERGNHEWNNFTHLNPQAQNLHQNIKDFILLKQGRQINRNHYNHDTGNFEVIEQIQPKNIIIHEGLHSLYLPQERRYYNLKIFIDPDPQLYHQWKISRDIQKRGYSEKKVISSIQNREKDKQKFISVQKDFADIIISYYLQKKQLILKLTGSVDIEIEPLIKIFSEINGTNIHVDIHEFKQNIEIRFNQEIPTSEFDSILRVLIPEIEEFSYPFNFTGNTYENFILLYIIFYIMQEHRLEIHQKERAIWNL